MRRILVLGAGYFHRRVYSKLRKHGFYLVGTDRDPHAHARDLAHTFYTVDITDSDGIIAIAEAESCDAVLPLNEFGMTTHAKAVEHLDLIGNSSEMAMLAVDKEQMRRRWREWGLPQPDFFAFDCDRGELSRIRERAMAIGFPCIIKPADSGGAGRGVMILNGPNEIADGIRFSSPFARTKRLIIEEFIYGTEATVEGLVMDGKHAVLAVSDKYKPPLQTRVATSLNYPASFNTNITEKIIETVNRAVKSLGLQNSATHTEVIVQPDGEVQLVELGARGGGGHIFSDIVEIVSGVDMPVALAWILCGEAPNIRSLRQDGACYRFFNPPTGILQEVRGVDRARTIPGVVDIGIQKKTGECVGQLPNSLERTGYVVTKGTTRADAWNTANLVEDTVQFVVSEE